MQIRKICLPFILMLLFSCFSYAQSQLSTLLENNKIDQLETYLIDVQRKFEMGELSEVELRNTYRIFYDPPSIAANNLYEWASAKPNSYVAHLALGIFYKRRGLDARGTKFIQDTPPENLRQMDFYLAQASKELKGSLKLADKPYLSLFHLLAVPMQYGDHEASRAILKDAMKMLPGNILVTNRYAITLLPRYGGSYQAYDLFAQQLRESGATTNTLLMLKALKLQDMGTTSRSQGFMTEAIVHYQNAILTGKEAGFEFCLDWLKESFKYVCAGAQKADICSITER